MTIDTRPTNWKDIAELLGIAAIVASLIFVGLQMKQTHEIALVTLYQMRSDSAREVAAVGLESAALGRVYELMESGETLGNHDRELAFTDLFMLMNHFENSHFLYLQGYLSEEHWQSDLESIRRTFDDPVAREFWIDRKGTFRRSFVEAIDEATRSQ